MVASMCNATNSTSPAERQAPANRQSFMLYQGTHDHPPCLPTNPLPDAGSTIVTTFVDQPACLTIGPATILNNGSAPPPPTASKQHGSQTASSSTPAMLTASKQYSNNPASSPVPVSTPSPPPSSDTGGQHSSRSPFLPRNALNGFLPTPPPEHLSELASHGTWAPAASRIDHQPATHTATIGHRCN